MANHPRRVDPETSAAHHSGIELRGDVEYEFGIPIAGRILPPTEWTQTGIKRWPDTRPLDWVALFGHSAPVVVDVGCGNGRFTLASAVQRPHYNHLAIDCLPVVIRYATRRANQRGLKNVRFGVLGGWQFVRDFLPSHAIVELHCYHPQPYYRPQEYRRRLITPEFLSHVHRGLQAGGLFVLQTDNPAYAQYMRQIIPAFFVLHELDAPWPDAPAGRTRREILARRAGLPIFRFQAIPRPELTEEDYPRLIRDLPRPTFDAERGGQDLDRWG